VNLPPSPIRGRISLLFLLILGVNSLVLDPIPSVARVGGGHSYSGGHSSSGGGSHSGGGSWGGGSYSSMRRSSREEMYIPLRVPGPGGVLTLIIILLLIGVVFSSSMKDVALTAKGGSHLATRPEWVNLGKLDNLKSRYDPDFSKPAFMDFVARLYAEVHQARGGRTLDSYSLFFKDGAIEALKKLSSHVQATRGVTLGAIRIENIEFDIKNESSNGVVRLKLFIDSCYTETYLSGSSCSWYVNDRWTLERSLNVRSQAPEKIQVIRCPSCGAAPQAARGICGSCGTSVNTGKFSWVVTGIETIRQERPPLLTQQVEEVGTDLPTLVDPDYRRHAEILQRDVPGFNWSTFRARALHIFVQAQRAWKERAPSKLRPFESDSLFSAHSYWIEEYKRQKLINDLQDLKIINFVPVKIEFDAYYVAITARIHAQMIDITRRETGEHLFGNTRKPREFTEYWTFIRSRMAPANPGADLNRCPSCGAALKINQAGCCEYCSSHIVAGEFDWVASLIEQDEAYHG
jgi:hypothetical protein